MSSTLSCVRHWGDPTASYVGNPDPALCNLTLIDALERAGQPATQGGCCGALLCQNARALGYELNAAGCFWVDRTSTEAPFTLPLLPNLVLTKCSRAGGECHATRPCCNMTQGDGKRNRKSQQSLCVRSCSITMNALWLTCFSIPTSTTRQGRTLSARSISALSRMQRLHSQHCRHSRRRGGEAPVVPVEVEGSAWLVGVVQNKELANNGGDGKKTGLDGSGRRRAKRSRRYL